MCIVNIGGQDVGVVQTPTGIKPVPLNTGWHVIAPWYEIHKMDKTVFVYTCAASKTEGAKDQSDAIWAPTKDGIKMGFDVSLSWSIDPVQAPWIFQNVSGNENNKSDGRYVWMEENVIRTKLKSAFALTVSEYSPIEIYSTKREDIQNRVATRLKTELMEYKLLLKQIDIREVYYNQEYEKSIQQKKLAEQEVMRLIEVTKQKEEQLKQAKIDKDIAIQQAEGEAKALQIKGSSIAQNPKIIDLEWINKWDGALPTYMMGGGSSGIMMNMPVVGKK
jgi:regulator of protease activity HflC (stomatin/prohibitin superfamily)